MMSKIVSLRLVEEDDEDTDLGKEVGDTYPPFHFQRFGSANGSHIYLVHAGQEFIGSLHLRHDAMNGAEKRSIAFVESQKRHTHIPIASKEEGAQLLWQDRMGIIQLPNNPPHYEPLGQVPDDPDHYESILKSAGKLVNFLAEDSEPEDEDNDFDSPNDLSYGQLENIISELQGAGFKILNHEDNKGTLTFSFSWPKPTASQYLNGWGRARDIIQRYMPLRMGNYTVRTEEIDGVKTAIAQVVKRAENDPHIWKVELKPRAKELNSYWNDIYFNGKQAGEAYLPAFSMAQDQSELLREELSELNEIVPFDPRQWPMGGNSWGRGPAINWWRANRNKLPNASTPYRNNFDKNLIGESYGVPYREKTF